MRHFRNIFFTLAAFLWLPASAHCQLETIPGLEFLQCAMDVQTPAGSTDCGDNACCAAEKSHYKIDQIRVSIPTPELLPLLPVTLASCPSQSTQADNTIAIAVTPPELFTRWQFVFRTASPPRAPSFAA